MSDASVTATRSQRTIFSAAPVSKLVALMTCVTSVAVGLSTIDNQAEMGALQSLRPAYFNLVPSEDTLFLSKWLLASGKFFLASFSCIAPGEMLLCIFALLSTAKLENAVGSVKLFQMVLFLFTGRVLGLAAWAVLCQRPDELAAVKPTVAWLALGLHACRRSITPAAPLFDVFGVTVTTQTLPDLVALQLVHLNSENPALVVVSVASGLVMASSIAALHSWLPWSFVCRCLPTASPVTVWHRNPPAAASSSASQLRQAGRTAAAAPPTESRRNVAQTAATAQVEDEDRVSELVSMGFPREAALSALRRTRNDVNEAAQLLLDGQ